MSLEVQFVSLGAATAGQSVFQESTTQQFPLGERLCLSDGRIFHYCSNGAGALTTGMLLQAPANPGAWNSLATADAAAGVSELEVTIVATDSLVKKRTDESSTSTIHVKNGFILNELTGELRKISTTDDVAASGTGTVETYCEWLIAWASDTAAIIANPWAQVIVHPTTQTGMTIGTAPIAITASTVGSTQYHFWAQTWGISSGKSHSTTSLVSMQAVGYGEVAGTFGLNDLSGAGNQPILGYVIGDSVVNSEWSLIQLMLHP